MAFHHTACFVFTVMIICNAILYPSIFSNIFRQWFGLGAKEEKPETPPAYPPHMRHNGPRSPPNRGPMAGERAAAQMAQSQKEGGGKSRGMMSSVLPVYAIGIVVYFAYIMYRIFFKEQSQQDPITGQPMNRNASEDDYGTTLEARKHREYEERLQRSLQQDLRSDKYRYSASADTRRTKKTAMAANRKDEESDVASLQKRLEDTEKAMQKMMEYMNKMGVAMSQVTEQMAQNDPSGPVVNKRDSPTHAPFANDQDIDNLDDGYMDEDDYEEEVIVKKVPVRRTPQGKKYAPVRKTVGQRAKSHAVKTVKSRPPPKRRVVYVEEVDDDEEEEEGHVQDLEPSNDDYQGYLREDHDDRHPDRMAGDGEDDDQDGLEDGDDDGQKFDDAEEDEDEDGNDEAEDYDDDDDDEVEVIEGETILPESVNDMPESIRRRAVKVENHGGNTEN
ncbi:resistance to inhibitors of cholinesterase protein 3-like isoform X2 [Ptychodera flava]|uniref:resistance to inhibitors of cholinesterase protein 3-like isoform X2 n=1 Tax=Ptychodera flava TaxID=63121 RepID=UPI00396A2D21